MDVTDEQAFIEIWVYDYFLMDILYYMSPWISPAPTDDKHTCLHNPSYR